MYYVLYLLLIIIFELRKIRFVTGYNTEIEILELGEEF